MKDAIIITIFVIAGGVGMIFLVPYLRQKSADNVREEFAEKVAAENPCDSILRKESIFNGMWIGMPKSLYHPSEESVSYKSEYNDKGIISWDTEWYHDSLVTLTLHMKGEELIPDQGHELTKSMNMLVTSSVFNELARAGFGRCESDLKSEDREMWCGRVGIMEFRNLAMIIIYDRCHAMKNKIQKEAEEAIEMAKSKQLFK